jgi:hypothetical protein
MKTKQITLILLVLLSSSGSVFAEEDNYDVKENLKVYEYKPYSEWVNDASVSETGSLLSTLRKKRTFLWEQSFKKGDADLRLDREISLIDYVKENVMKIECAKKEVSICLFYEASIHRNLISNKNLIGFHNMTKNFRLIMLSAHIEDGIKNFEYAKSKFTDSGLVDLMGKFIDAYSKVNDYCMKYKEISFQIKIKTK